MKGVASWVIAVGIVALLTLAILSYYSGKQFKAEYKDGRAAVGFLDPRSAEPLPAAVESWHGYFNDWDARKQTKITDETLSIAFYPGNAVRITSKADVYDDRNNLETLQWNYQGYLIGNYFVLSYATKGARSIGAGNVFLANSGSDYLGRWEGIDCKTKSIIRCPYVLSQKNLTREQALQRWPQVLKEACSVVLLDPDVRTANCTAAKEASLQAEPAKPY